MNDKLITLIGGGGFLGRYVAQALLSAGARVRIAQRNPGAALAIKPLGALGQTQFVAADICRPQSLARAVHGADAVVNLVGILKGNFTAIHEEGAANVARAAAAAGTAALVHVSAIGADAHSLSAYGRSKAAGEAGVQAAFAGATIVRPSLIFGREDEFVNRFARMIAAAPLVPVIKPDVRFQPIFVADVAAAIARALAEPASHAGRIYELGGPDILSMEALIRWIAGAIGRQPKIVPLPDALSAMIARAGFLPGAPLTWDHWQMLQNDNVATAGMAGIAAFDISPTPLAVVAPNWLAAYRKHGRFAAVMAR